MDELIPLAERVARKLIERGETISLAEGSSGGLVSAALLAVPGASAYFVGGAIVYTAPARHGLVNVQDADMAGMRASTEPYARLLARSVRERCGTTWGVGESGAAGPTGNRYGDAAGHSCIGIAGPAERSTTLETGSTDRRTNMQAFAAATLQLLAEALEA
jgi:PncC family amidohydrolase